MFLSSKLQLLFLDHVLKMSLKCSKMHLFGLFYLKRKRKEKKIQKKSSARQQAGPPGRAIQRPCSRPLQRASPPCSTGRALRGRR
jgi:hypothetical protein